jgi:hypothetical protein
MIIINWNLLGLNFLERFITKIRRLKVKRFAKFLVFLLFADFSVEPVVFLVIGSSKKAGPDFI